MKRKDLLIGAIILVIILFGTVAIIYYGINGKSIFKGIQETLEERNMSYENGWDKAIVGQIKDGVPIPVGFTYIEGNKETGIIIKDNKES